MQEHAPRKCDPFFSDVDTLRLALEFDDVTIRTDKSEVMPSETNLEAKFSRNVGLKIPIISAAMDTVTEVSLAIELANEGGIGVIHRNLTPEDQAAQVKQVKRHLNGLIEKPITVRTSETIEQILAWRAEKRFPFHKFPVIGSYGRLEGLLTKDDFDLCDNVSKTAAEVMTKELIVAGPDTTLPQAYDLMRAHKKKALPLVNADGQLVGMYDFSDVKRIMSGEKTAFNLDAKGRLRVAAAVGVHDDAYSRIALFPSDIDVIVIDTAHGDSKNVVETLRALKKESRSFDIVVGNVTEPDSAKRLLDLGADAIKVGQGPGSICTTRVITGVGCPQLTAIYNCARVVRGQGVPIIADGGICYPGDIPKAIVAGADSVMLGRLLAGCEEAPGETFTDSAGRRMKKYRGMGSLGAMKNRGGRERYGQGDMPQEKLVPEGIEGAVPYTGMLADAIHQYVGGLRSSMAYVGARTLPELQRRGDFRRITQNGVETSHPHDIMLIADAPNYRR